MYFVFFVKHSGIVTYLTTQVSMALGKMTRDSSIDYY